MLYEKIIADLEAKLAEKEEKIEEVKKWWAYQYNREMKNQHQEKISFAVEQLGKVKNNLIDRLADIDEQFMNDIWDEEQYARMCWENWDTNKFIDNLIKEIKDETISN